MLPVAAFSDADKNHDGYLSMDEYIRVFHEHGVNITAEEVALYFATKVFKLNSSLIWLFYLPILLKSHQY